MELELPHQPAPVELHGLGSNPEALHGLLLSEGEFTEIQISGADTAALGINADGLIVGAFQPDYHNHGFLAIPR